MNPIISYIGFGIVIVILILFRINWMKDIPDLTNKKVLEAASSRIVLDIVYVTLFAWPIFRLPFDLDFMTMYRILWSFMLGLTVLFFLIYNILRWKFVTSKGN